MMFNRLKNLLFGSLRKQLIVGMTLVIVSMMTLFIWNTTSRQQDEEIKSHAQQVSALAESAATSSAVWVASRDYSGLQEIVSDIARYPDLRYIIVLDLKGQVLAHNDSSKIGSYLTDLPQQKEQTALHRTANLVDVITPITLAGKHIGWVRLGIDRTHFNAEIAQTRQDGLVFTLIGIVFSILIAFSAGRILTGRLAAIQQVADEVNAGNANERVVLSGDDEAAKLAGQFNGMLDSLAERKATYFAQNQQSMREINAKVIELDRVNAELERKNKEMESMIYSASHDLRSPLVNIQGFSQRLEKAVIDINARLGQEDVPEKVRSDLARNLNERIPSALGFIKSSSLKMDTLINGLLRLSRIGRAELTIQPLDMNIMLRDIVGNLTIQAHQAGATISVDNLPACLGDSTQINQVFSNLIDNAIKYRDPVRPLEIHITGSLNGERACYAVADTGIGIAENYQPKVWELFHRLDPNGPIAGEGLGLTLVQRILARHRGRISLISNPGKGSCFTVELPAAFLMEKTNDQS